MKVTITDEKREEIAALLKEKGVQYICPMCKHKHFILVDGYFNPSIQSNLKGFRIGGLTIPSIAIICGNCGFISQHSLGALGIDLTGDKDDAQ